MSVSSAHPADGPQLSQLRSPDLHAASHSILASDWVEVPNFAHTSAALNDIQTELTHEGFDQSSIASCDNEDAQTGAVLVGAWNECDQCDQCALASPLAGVQAPTNISGVLKEEVHAARERHVRDQEDQTFADGAGLPCIGEPDIDDDAKSESTDASDIPHCVEDYFEYEREAFVSDERLMELDVEHNLSPEIRKRNIGLDCGLDAAFEESEKIYKRKRQELSEALAIAHYRLFVRRNACIAQGLDPESFRYRHR